MRPSSRGRGGSVGRGRRGRGGPGRNYYGIGHWHRGSGRPRECDDGKPCDRVGTLGLLGGRYADFSCVLVLSRGPSGSRPSAKGASTRRSAGTKDAYWLEPSPRRPRRTRDDQTTGRAAAAGRLVYVPTGATLTTWACPLATRGLRTASAGGCPRAAEVTFAADREHVGTGIEGEGDRAGRGVDWVARGRHDARRNGAGRGNQVSASDVAPRDDVIGNSVAGGRIIGAPPDKGPRPSLHGRIVAGKDNKFTVVLSTCRHSPLSASICIPWPILYSLRSAYSFPSCSVRRKALRAPYAAS